ncbi:MAG: anaerobic ribonucleoside-triphosphate reductase activating protein, partial [Niameybacter sp.]
LDHSLVNGEGFRSVIFLSGCHHHCPGCHNVAMQDFAYGDQHSIQAILDKIKKNLPLIDGVTLSGGDPFEQSVYLLPLLQGIHSLGLTIWCYTGYIYEDLLENPSHNALLPYIDVLVDGRFEASLQTDTKRYVGSSNQRILKLLNGIALQELKY